jgi:hypothetical protein
MRDILTCDRRRNVICIARAKNLKSKRDEKHRWKMIPTTHQVMRFHSNRTAKSSEATLSATAGTLSRRIGGALHRTN